MIALIAAAAMFAPTASRACDTPVYRYAMYNWVPADFEVFYLHGGEEHPDDATTNQILDGFRAAAPEQVNVVLIGVDTSREDQLAAMPEVVREAWQSQGAGALPLHVVVNPRGRVLFTGRLDESQAKAMIDSPARRKMAQLLHDGNGGVLLVLNSNDAAANASTHEAVEKVVAMAAGGELATEAIPGVEVIEQGAVAEPESVGVMYVNRDDEAESWLVRMLLSVEDDLTDYDEPMVFGVYGRGRALEPYIGAGIVPANLAECVSFIRGACSCLVKEQNPGMDLLCQWDWDATAIAMAEQVGEEEGNERLVDADTLFPQIVMTVEQPADTGEASTADDEISTFDEPGDPGDDQVAALSLDAQPERAEHAADDADSPATSVEETNAAGASQGAYARRMSRIVLFGAVVAFIGLAAISFLMLRSRAGA